MHRWELLSIIGTGATASIALAALIISQNNGIRADMNSGFDRIDARFTALDSRFTTLDSRFTTVDNRFTTLETRFNSIEGRFTFIEGKLTSIERDVADLRERSARIETLLEYTLPGPVDPSE